MKYKRFCKLCNKIINVIQEKLGHKSKHNKSMQICTSEEGVYFSDGKAWFCNKCWKLVSKGEFK